MTKIDFDEYAGTYDQIMRDQLNFFDGSVEYIAEYKIKAARAFFKTPPETILDFGCGVGRSIPFFKKHFPSAHLYGSDLSEKSLSIARKQFPYANFYVNEALLDNGMQFDLIFLSGVLHHVKREERRETVRLLKALLKKGGKIIIFEHNPLNPVTRKLVRECPFDADAVLLWPNEIKSLLANAGFSELRCHYTLFFPSVLKFLRPLERCLKFLPLGGQYLVCGEEGAAEH